MSCKWWHFADRPSLLSNVFRVGVVVSHWLCPGCGNTSAPCSLKVMNQFALYSRWLALLRLADSLHTPQISCCPVVFLRVRRTQKQTKAFHCHEKNTSFLGGPGRKDSSASYTFPDPVTFVHCLESTLLSLLFLLLKQYVTRQLHRRLLLAWHIVPTLGCQSSLPLNTVVCIRSLSLWAAPSSGAAPARSPSRPPVQSCSPAGQEADRLFPRSKYGLLMSHFVGQIFFQSKI